MPLCKTYYVNAETGRDSFDGLSEATAFASLRAVNRLTLQPGDRVRLACGSVFGGAIPAPDLLRQQRCPHCGGRLRRRPCPAH